MKDVHPSDTAGDGKPVNSRPGKPGDPRESRITCAQCGFIVDTERDAMGDTGSDNQSGGTEIRNTTITINQTVNNLPIHLRDMATFRATSRVVKEPVVTSGCPLCGTYNPTARGRSSDPFMNSRDLSNE